VRSPTINAPPEAPEKPPATRAHGRLFRKYVGLFLAVVCIALLTNGLSEIVFSFQEHKASLIRIQREQADGGDVRRVVTQEGAPSLARRPTSLDHVLAIVDCATSKPSGSKMRRG
jgi:hypothetical protein